jgi:hypothetical protein
MAMAELKGVNEKWHIKRRTTNTSKFILQKNHRYIKLLSILTNTFIKKIKKIQTESRPMQLKPKLNQHDSSEGW